MKAGEQINIDWTDMRREGKSTAAAEKLLVWLFGRGTSSVCERASSSGAPRATLAPPSGGGSKWTALRSCVGVFGRRMKRSAHCAVHTGIFCQNFFHSTIIPPWRVSWVSREADKLKELSFWSAVFPPKWSNIEKMYKSHQNPLISYCFWGYFQTFSILAGK